MHTLICGRARKNIKLIESETDTAIYFPPPFPRLCGYCPPGAMRRQEDEILITGKDPEHIMRAKRKLHDLVIQCKTFVKTVVVTDSKIDNLILERLEKVQKIIENNGSYILLPPLGLQRGVVRVQGTDVLNVERTVRELMHLVGCMTKFVRNKLTLPGWSILQCFVVHYTSGPLLSSTFAG